MADQNASTDDDGLSVVLTPVQLAAVLDGASISTGESLSNRLWGGAKLVFAAVDLVGAGLLLAAPEPTTATKFAGWGLGLYGADVAQSGARQIWSGEDVQTLTREGATAAAHALGMDQTDAERVGFWVDILVPIAIAGGLGAARVLSVRAGTIDLAAEEEVRDSAGKLVKEGGHTVAKHIGKDEAWLRARLAAEPKIPAAGSFRTLAEAERFVSDALRANKSAIEAWSRGGAMGKFPPIIYDAGRTITGSTVTRATGLYENCTKVLIVLRKSNIAGKVYFVLTSYPVK